jgi:hypothetical protein
MLILAPKVKRIDVSRPDAVFAQIADTIAPPPEMAQPPLWSKPDQALEQLGKITWPPVLQPAKGK